MTIETLGDAWTHSVRLHLRCTAPERDGLKSIRKCGFRHELDVLTLLCTRGRAFPLSMLSSRMKCPSCGSVHMAVAFSLPGNTNTAVARVR